MIELSRTVRFSSNLSVQNTYIDAPTSGYAGSMALHGLSRFEEVVVRCRGAVDPVNCYLIDIKDVDRAVRTTVAPIIGQAVRDSVHGRVDPASVLARAASQLATALPLLASITWNITPFLSLEVVMPPSPAPTTAGAPTAPTTPTKALLRQKFEFAASHRLHVASLSDEENRALFGKCNHPSGHGHNYILEPCVEVAVGGHATLSVGELDRLTHALILDRFDHKYLNIDTPEFGPSGVVPSVENIARVFYDLLAPAITATGLGTLVRLTVWESERTAATYPA